MPDTHPPQRQPWRLALLSVMGVLGGAMVVLPLGHVWQQQGAEIEKLLVERSTLFPMTHALAVQRCLLNHRDVAERVLLGRSALEPERRLRQSHVEEQLWILQGTLSAGYWVKALGESRALTEDWHGLVQRVVRRQITAADSTTSHQLLLEQAVQVMDLVGAAAPAGSRAQAMATWLKHSQTRALPTPNAAERSPQLLELQDAVHVQLQEQLQEQLQDVDEQTAARRSERNALGTALTALLVLAAGLLSWFALGASHSTRAASAAASDGVRRSTGRRAVDATPPRADADELLGRLRQSATDAVADSPPTQPPGA